MIKSLVNEEVIRSLIECARLTPRGAFVEVGVYQGGTAQYLSALAEQQGRKIYLYDTFNGIPYQGVNDAHRIGELADTSLEYVQEHIPYAFVIPGVFPMSAVEMGPIAFVHLDCDQSQAYRESIDYLMPRMVKGGRMWFDDSPCLDGPRLVVESIFGDRVKIVKGKHTIEMLHGLESRRPSV